MTDVKTRSGSTVEIQSVMVLSTGHLTETTAMLLNASDARDFPPLDALPARTFPWSPQLRWEYGWVWYVDSGTNGSADFPPEFAAIFALALALDCNWVRFDQDGPQIDELPFYEW